MKFRYNNRGGAATAAGRKGQVALSRARKNQNLRWKRRWQNDVIFLLNAGVEESTILENLPPSAKAL